MIRLLTGFLALGMFFSIHSSPAADENPPTLQDELQSAAPQVPSFPIDDEMPLAWEAHHPERQSWSKYAFGVINQYLDELNQSEDMPRFCPNYNDLDRDQQVEAWGQVIAGVSYWETSWDPANRTEEGPDVDPITNKIVYSEGLLQLSYQDSESNPYCVFDYDADKKLKPEDLHRTILNPYNNLYCGIRIMADLVRDNKRVSPDKDQHGYWSTLQTGDRLHNRASYIAKLSVKLPFCGQTQKMSIGEFLMNILKKNDSKFKRIKRFFHHE